MFGVVRNVAVSTLLMSYLLIVPSAYRLRRIDTRGAFKVPGGRVGLALCTALALARVSIGVWQSILPGTLEPLFGVEYDFAEKWGVARGTFELFTFAPLGAIAVLAIAGYLFVRAKDRTRG